MIQGMSDTYLCELHRSPLLHVEIVSPSLPQLRGNRPMHKRSGMGEHHQFLQWLIFEQIYRVPFYPPCVLST